MLGTSNITTTLVGNELGVSGNNVSVLCKSDKINMWSKWKPIKSTSLGGITESILQSSNYGLSYQTFVSVSDAAEYFDGIMNGWIYDRPYDIFRLGDFRNYKHDAKPIIHSYTNTESAINSTPGATMGASAILNDDPNDVRLIDIPNFQTMYFGIIIKKGSTVRYSTSTAPLGDNQVGMNVLLSTYNLPVGSYEVYPVLCAQPYINNTNSTPAQPVGQSFIPVPNVKIGYVLVVDSEVTVDLRGMSDRDGLVTWECTISVMSGANAISFDTNYVWLRFARNNITDAIQSGEIRNTISNFVVQGGQTKTLSGEIQIPRKNEMYNLWITLKSSTYIRQTAIMIPM